MTTMLSRWIEPWRAKWRPVSAVLHAPPHEPGEAACVDAGVAALADWAAEHPGARLQLGLSSRWLLCAATPEATTPAEALAQARAQWAHYQGVDESTLQDAWVSLPICDARVRLVCAAPRALIEGLSEAARSHRVRLEAVLPWWAHGLQRRTQAWQADSKEAVCWSWNEPGWRTCVELAPAADASVGCLQRIWMSGPEAAQASRLEEVASLPDVGPLSRPRLVSDASLATWLGAAA